jgi:hypothetical protein
MSTEMDAVHVCGEVVKMHDVTKFTRKMVARIGDPLIPVVPVFLESVT